MYTYIKSEPQLWTVGFHASGGMGPNRDWHPESDHHSEAEAAARVHYLNGGSGGKGAERSQLFWNQQSAWSQATFGPDSERGPVGPLKHLEKEAREAQAEMPGSTEQESEIVDCLFLVFDAARRAGITHDRLFRAAFEKLEINKRRKWEKPESDNEPVEHVR